MTQAGPWDPRPWGPRESAPPAPARPEAPVPFRFTGRAGEFFGIWIVNLVLTLFTLGVFSAWAKVRQNRYLLGHTRILGYPLEYRARGLAILIGRLLSLLVLGGIGAAGTVSLAAQGLTLLGAALVIPWAINRSLRFRARVTAWRNVPFDWHGTYGGTFVAFILWPAAALLSLGLLAPLAARAGRQYLANHHSFGGERFTATTAILPYYAAGLWAVLLGGAIGLLGGLGMFLFWKATGNGDEEAAVLALLVPLSVAGTAMGIAFLALARNILVNGLRLGPAAAFHCNLSALRSVWILLSNAVVTIASLGLMYPWARIRWQRYQVERLAVTPLAAVDSFLDTARRTGGAFGEELSDLGDFGPVI